MGSGGSYSLWPPGKTVDAKLFVELSRPIQKAKSSKIEQSREFFESIEFIEAILNRVVTQNTWVLYGQASRAISTR